MSKALWIWVVAGVFLCGIAAIRIWQRRTEAMKSIRESTERIKQAMKIRWRK